MIGFDQIYTKRFYFIFILFLFYFCHKKAYNNKRYGSSRQKIPLLSINIKQWIDLLKCTNSIKCTNKLHSIFQGACWIGFYADRQRWFASQVRVHRLSGETRRAEARCCRLIANSNISAIHSSRTSSKRWRSIFIIYNTIKRF